MKIIARFDVPLAKHRKSHQVAAQSIVVDSDKERDIQYVPDEEEAAQLDLKPAANVASSNSTTDSNHGIDIYPSSFEFVSFLFPFLVTCYLCYQSKSSLPLYGGATCSLLLLSTELVPTIVQALYHHTATRSLQLPSSPIDIPWQLLVGPMLWVGLILITIYHPKFVHFEQPKLPRATRRAVEAHVNRARRKSVKSTTFRAPRLKGRKHLCPHHKPCHMAPPLHFCKSLHAYADCVDHATNTLHCPKVLYQLKLRAHHHQKHSIHRVYHHHSPQTNLIPWS